ncbi:MAG: SMP-30/gluconolactonase/LRE family protein [Blastococcus sp.]
MRIVQRDQALLKDGFAFPEGLRFHDGKLWFSDMHTGDVFSLDPDDGSANQELKIDDQPSGLGWLDDGSLLLSMMKARQILRVYPDGRQVIHADLSALEEHPTNELLVDSTGRAYLGSFGYDIYAGAPLVQGSVYLIDRDGTASVAAGGFDFPNGTVILPGTRTLVVAHSFRPELTGFDIQDDGSLVNRRVWATLPERATADGLAVAPDGQVWVSSLLTSEFFRVSEGGEITCHLSVPDRLAVDCVLDERDENVLYLSTSNSIQPSETTVRVGAIERIEL